MVGVDGDVGATGLRTNGSGSLRVGVVGEASAGFGAASAARWCDLSFFLHMLLWGGLVTRALVAVGATRLTDVRLFRRGVLVRPSVGSEAVELGELGLKSTGSTYPLVGVVGSEAPAEVAAGLDPFELNSELLGDVVS